MMRGEFGQDGSPYFVPVERKPPDLKYLQSVMFMDRPDLWRKPKRRVNKRTDQNQGVLL